ncbi:MAG TPA: DNA-processing protein DprA [Streptosporangiaceae bacterium]|nr:DNA-processing protein DprA [Streptosporangiaceae bacterium]
MTGAHFPAEPGPATAIAAPDTQRLAHAALAYIAEPADPVMTALSRSWTPAEVIALLRAGGVPGGPWPGLDRRLPRWLTRLREAPTEATLDSWHRAGIRLVIPSDPEWPTQLDSLGAARPWALWVRGHGDLRYACLRSVSVVGTRAATAYGNHVCADITVTLAERGWTVVSGGAYGIDACAHRSALAAGGSTVAVLACGADVTYPRGHEELFDRIVGRGVVVSEWPPGRLPTKRGFLTRNRVIAALSRGTVVVEAASRSGALNTARHARDQNRPLMAVPGPVTSSQSAGCHEIIRNWGAICVTSAADVVEVLAFADDEPMREGRHPLLPLDQLDLETSQVLSVVPGRTGRGPASIAAAAGVGLDTVMRCLGLLASAGFIERCPQGWRKRRESQ